MKKTIMAVLMVLCLALTLCACDGSEPQNQTDATTTTVATTTTTASTQATAKFEAKVVDQNGNAVAGVMVQICKDTCVPKVTDANGVAAFDLEITDGYKLSVMSCPAGYTYTGEAEIYLESGCTSYTIEVQSEG